MARITALDREHVAPRAGALLDAVKQKLGMVPNMMRTMAQSAAVLDGYLALNAALARGQLGGRVGEQIALLTAEQNGCAYCAAAHTALGKGGGLSDADIDAARSGRASDAKAAAALALARAVIETRGHVADADITAARKAGLADGEIGEVVAHVALNVFTNYFNSLADTDVDFPAVRPPRKPHTDRQHVAVSA
ncbi:MAG TPA: carboxymuconolactone decarboxylase family protein [Gemmatimonadaceae bacterium]